MTQEDKAKFISDVTRLSNEIMQTILKNNPAFMSTQEAESLYDDFKIGATALNGVMARCLAVMTMVMKAEGQSSESVTGMVNLVHEDLNDALVSELKMITMMSTVPKNSTEH